MRSVSRVIAIAVVAGSLIATPAAPSSAQSRFGLDGHWQCSGAGIPSTERSYVTLGGRDSVREVFGIADRTERNGSPSSSFEHMTELADHSYTVESVEGSGLTDPNAVLPLRFAGRSTDDATTFTLIYSFDGATLHRVATRGSTVVGDERCTREPDPSPTTCPRPNAPARTIKPVEPYYPAEAVPRRATGLVQVRIVLDDRSRVLWADIARSADPVFNDSARLAARDSTYQTAIRDCRPVAATYIFGVDYGI